MEHQKLYALGNGTLASMAVAIVAAVMLSPASALVFPLALGYVVLAPLAALARRAMIRRQLATHRLMPTSKPLRLLAASENTLSVANRKESAYEIRRRRGKSKKGRGSGGGVRAVFMTRGGYFYQ